MNNFHWILFSFCMARSKVFVFDSLYKTIDKSRYEDVIELIKAAWTCLCGKHLGKFNNNLYVHYDWPVCVLAYSLLTRQWKFISWLCFPICAGHDAALRYQSVRKLFFAITCIMLQPAVIIHKGAQGTHSWSPQRNLEKTPSKSMN
jgi:hypothetical protein